MDVQEGKQWFEAPVNWAMRSTPLATGVPLGQLGQPTVLLDQWPRGFGASTSTSMTWGGRQSCWAHRWILADDFALHVDAKGVGYISSNRDGGMDRIYNIKLIDIVADFEITVVTCDDEVASNVDMDLHNLSTGEQSKVRTDADGVVNIRTMVGETAQLSFEGDDVFAGMGTKSYMADEEALRTVLS